MLTLKKINFKPSNFNYYFKIILFYRNDDDYCAINNVEKVIPKESYKWLKKNHKNRIFLIIKYKAKNIGMINFDKLDETFSIVIDRNYRNVGLGGLGFRAWKLLLRYLKSQKYKHLITYALKSNISAYKLNLYFSYKKRLLKNGFTKFYIDVEKF
tara:strand:- start:199 stop:663 length:465 start_codon:yes stop_codon:yes gene_type:complete